jgi:hypothetical protein
MSTRKGNTGGPGTGFSTSLSKGLLASASLADEVAKLEAIAKEHEGCQCGEVRATLIVNFGDDGRAVPGLVKQDMGTLEMIMAVLRHYYDCQQRGRSIFDDNQEAIL